eukprot:470581-Prymnesium_polylepis.1
MATCHQGVVRFHPASHWCKQWSRTVVRYGLYARPLHAIEPSPPAVSSAITDARMIFTPCASYIQYQEMPTAS